MKFHIILHVISFIQVVNNENLQNVLKLIRPLHEHVAQLQIADVRDAQSGRKDRQSEFLELLRFNHPQALLR